MQIYLPEQPPALSPKSWNVNNFREIQKIDYTMKLTVILLGSPPNRSQLSFINFKAKA